MSNLPVPSGVSGRISDLPYDAAKRYAWAFLLDYDRKNNSHLLNLGSRCDKFESACGNSVVDANFASQRAGHESSS